MKRIIQILVLLSLALTLVLNSTACNVLGQPTTNDGTNTDEITSTSTPEETESTPEESTPEETTPEETTPEETTPDETTPDETTPEVTTPEETTPEECEHPNKTTTTVNATCTEKGSITITCDTCGETVSTEEIAALGHAWDNACDTECNNGCGETREIEHNYNSVVTDPTCTDKGYTTYTCTVCGDNYKEDGEAALGHAWDNACDTECNNGCGETREIEHNYNSVVTDPTCTDKGYTTYTCTVCGDSYQEDGEAALGHAWDNACDTECNNGCGETREIVPKSVGNSTTTAEDMTSDRQIERTLHMLSESVAERLRKHTLKGTVVQITVRDRDLSIYEKQKIIYKPTDDAKVIYAAARDLFKESYDWEKGVRSIGVRCTKLVRADSGEQLSIFNEVKASERDDRLNKAIDDINRRYGSSVIKSAAEAEVFTKQNKAANIVTDPFHPEDVF